MNKRPLLIFCLLLVGGGLAWLGINWYNKRELSGAAFTEKDLAKAAARLHLDRPTQPEIVHDAPISPSQTVRLAVGSLGLPNDGQNRQLGDLLTVELSGAKGLELVDRQSFDKVLRELEMNLSGLVRAKDAVRVGKLLRADWFLLGSAYSVGGTTGIVARIVDARTGILRDVGIFQGSEDTQRLAGRLADFTRQYRQAAATIKPRVYLAVGGFADMGVNARQSAFPAQLRAYLTGAYQHSSLTLLEREAVSAMLQEVRLDLAGLTEEGSAGEPQPVQSAFWVVDGYFQSYETSGFEVELVLHVNQAFGRSASTTLRGAPEEPLLRRIKESIDTTLAQARSSQARPSRRREISHELDMGRDLMKAAWGIDPAVTLSAGTSLGNELDHPRRRHNLQEAIRAFETVLLLDHTNRQAKLFLAGCLQDWTIGRWDEARYYFQEVANAIPPDQWAKKAQAELKFLNYMHSGNTTLAGNAGDLPGLGIVDPKALELAEKRLIETVRKESYAAFAHFVSEFGTNKAAAADHLETLWPRLKGECSDMVPELLANLLPYVVSTNSPIIAEFRQSLAESVRHPEKVIRCDRYLGTVALVDYEWCMNLRLYPLAVEILQAKREAARNAPGIPFNEKDKVRLAFAYVPLERWRDALTIFEELGEKPVNMDRPGPWGGFRKLFLPAPAAAACRRKLALPSFEIANRFDFGSPCLCLHTPSSFAADQDALWVAAGGKLLQLGFNLATNLQVALPVDESVPITALCLGPDQIWIGTGGAGLVEYNKATGKCRLMTEAEGLLRNDIACLCRQEKALWIGCGQDTGGAVGKDGGLARLDLAAGRLSAFTPSLPANPVASESRTPFIANWDPPNGPPAHALTALGGGLPGEVWMFVAGQGLRRYFSPSGSWSPLSRDLEGRVISFRSDNERLVAGLGFEQVVVGLEINPTGGGTNTVVRTNLILNAAELPRFQAQSHPGRRVLQISHGTLQDEGGLDTYSLREGRWLGSLDSLRLPAPPTSILVDGQDIWVAGWGYVAVVDTSLKSVRKMCYISSRTVDQLQIAGGFIWAQFDGHLHKAPLSSTR